MPDENGGGNPLGYEVMGAQNGGTARGQRRGEGHGRHHRQGEEALPEPAAPQRAQQLVKPDPDQPIQADEKGDGA